MKNAIITTVTVILLSTVALSESGISNFIFNGETVIGMDYNDGRSTRWEYDPNGRLLYVLPTIGANTFKITYYYFETGPNKDRIESITLQAADSPTIIQKVRYKYDNAGRANIIEETTSGNSKKTLQIGYVPGGVHEGKVSKLTHTQTGPNNEPLKIEENFNHLGLEEFHVRKQLSINNVNLGSTDIRVTPGNKVIVTSPEYKKTTEWNNGELQIQYDSKKSGKLTGNCAYTLANGNGQCSVSSLDENGVRQDDTTEFKGRSMVSEKVKLSINNEQLYSREIDYKGNQVTKMSIKKGSNDEVNQDYRYDENGRLTETREMEIIHKKDSVTVAAKAGEDSVDLFTVNYDDNHQITNIKIAENTLTAQLQARENNGEFNVDNYAISLDAPDYELDETGNPTSIRYGKETKEEFYFDMNDKLVYYTDRDNTPHYLLEGIDLNPDNPPSSSKYALDFDFDDTLLIKWINNIAPISLVFESVKS
ncbi:MAG: hypothetical protein O2779_01775 [Nanoarchaeota archaeon]|nr:hypothetical protein [Nanoarchaeota archaeon]